MPTLRVLILADDPLARAGLAALLAGEEGLTVTGQDAPAAVAEAAALFQPQAALWDLGPDPAAARARLEDAVLEDVLLPVVFLFPTGDAPPPLPNLSIGVGLIPRSARPAMIAAALQAAYAGLAVIAPEWVEGASISRIEPPAVETTSGGDVEVLTAREQDVLRLLAEGLPNKGIAQRLGITENTVKYHVNAILGKLGAQSRTEAVTKAARAGWLAM